MSDLPQNHGNEELKKTPPEQNYVAAETAADENKRAGGKLSAWAVLLSVLAAVILLAILLNQKKPQDNNSSSRQKDNISLEKSLINPKGKSGAAGNSATVTDTAVNFGFPPKNLAIEPANPGGIYENRLAISEEPQDWEAPLLKFMPLRLDLSPAKPTGRFWIRNDGRPDLTFHLLPNTNQITVSPASGRLKTDQTVYITVTASGYGMVIIDTNGGYDNVKIDYKP